MHDLPAALREATRALYAARGVRPAEGAGYGRRRAEVARWRSLVDRLEQAIGRVESAAAGEYRAAAEEARASLDAATVMVALIRAIVDARPPGPEAAERALLRLAVRTGADLGPTPPLTGARALIWRVWLVCRVAYPSPRARWEAVRASLVWELGSEGRSEVAAVDEGTDALGWVGDDVEAVGAWRKDEGSAHVTAWEADRRAREWRAAHPTIRTVKHSVKQA